MVEHKRPATARTTGATKSRPHFPIWLQRTGGYALPRTRRVARTGGDEFSMLAVECDCAQGEQLAGRLEANLARESLTASVGHGCRSAMRIADMWKVADEAMYVAKRNRKGERVPSVA